jgi:hypothetical protein
LIAPEILDFYRSHTFQDLPEYFRVLAIRNDHDMSLEYLIDAARVTSVAFWAHALYKGLVPGTANFDAYWDAGINDMRKEAANAPSPMYRDFCLALSNEFITTRRMFKANQNPLDVPPMSFRLLKDQ